MNRRNLLAGAAALVLLAGCAGSPGLSATPSATPSPLPATTVGLSYIPNIQFAPFYVADSKKLFSGAEVTLRHHGASEGLFTALTSGEEQFVIAGGDEALQAVAAGQDLVAIASYFKTYPVQLLTLESSPVTDLAGLKGRRVGVPGRYGETWFGLLVALRNAGLTEKDVTVVEIGYTQQTALATGKVDAIVGFSNNEGVQLAAAGTPVRPIAIGDEVPLVSICLVTTRATLTADPALARAVVAGMTAGIEATAADQAAAVELSGGYVPGLSETGAKANAAAVLAATVAVMGVKDGQFDPALDLARWSEMASFMAENGLVRGDVDPTRAATNDYVA